MKEIVASLDIGTSHVRVVIAKPNIEGKIQILGMGEVPSEGIVRGNIINIDKTVESIALAVKQASSAARVGIQHVNVAISGRNVKSVHHSGSITREGGEEEVRVADVMRLTKDIYRTASLQGSEVIHVVPQSYQVGDEHGIKDPVGIEGVKLAADCLVVAVSNKDVNNIYKCLKRTGLAVNKITFGPLADGMAVLTEEEKEAGVCLINIGGGCTGFAIFHDKILKHAGNIPIAGNIISDDIREGCTVMLPQADLLKVKYGRAMEEVGPYELVVIPGLRNRSDKEISARILARIIEARLQEIIQWVYAEIISAGFQQKLAGGIVLTGGSSQLRGIQEMVKCITKYDTRIGDPQEYLCPHQFNITPAHATVLGLALESYIALDYREEQYKNKLCEDQANTIYKPSPTLPGKEKPTLFQKFKGIFVGRDDDED